MLVVLHPNIPFCDLLINHYFFFKSSSIRLSEVPVFGAIVWQRSFSNTFFAELFTSRPNRTHCFRLQRLSRVVFIPNEFGNSRPTPFPLHVFPATSARFSHVDSSIPSGPTVLYLFSFPGTSQACWADHFVFCFSPENRIIDRYREGGRVERGRKRDREEKERNRKI